MAGLLRDDLPEVVLSETRMQEVLVDIKRNSRNRRIAMVAPLALAAAVLAAMIAAPPRHGGLLVADADAEAADPQLPRVFGSNGVWQLAVPIDDDPVGDLGPASVVEVATEPASPSFTLSPPDQEELQSLPASTSTPPMSTSGQSPDGPVDPADLDWSQFEAVIRVETVETGETGETVDAAVEPAAEPDPSLPDPQPVAEDSATPDLDTATASAAAVTESDTTDTPSSDGDVTVAALETLPQDETDPTEANPSSPLAESTEPEALPFSTPATILTESVLVHSAHVSVTVQVVDDDSSVVDWCNTRVDWGDGSVSRVAGVDESALCTASCEYEAEASTAGNVSQGNVSVGNGSDGGDISMGIAEVMQFEHDYLEVIDAAPRIFVATGDGCSYTLAELQLPPFTVVPLG